MEAVISGLREVEGVLGSFVIDGDGNMLARDLPPLFDAEMLKRASLHLSRLRDALESDGSNFESCVARFGPHLVLLRAARALTLCVLLPRGTNLGAVQMSATLIARKLVGSSNPSRNSEPTPPAAGKPAPAPSRRLFRGRRV